MSHHALLHSLFHVVMLAGVTPNAHANTPVTPHVWRLKLHDDALDSRELRATLELSAQQVRAQLGASLSGGGLERYVRDRLRLRHQHMPCETVDFQEMPHREATPDLIQFELRMRCAQPVIASNLVASSTLFASQHHPIPTLLEIVDLSTRPPTIVARATFDNVHMTYPEQPASLPPARRAPRKNAPAPRAPWCIAIFCIGLFLLVCGAFWWRYKSRTSTTTR